MNGKPRCREKNVHGKIGFGEKNGKPSCVGKNGRRNCSEENERHSCSEKNKNEWHSCSEKNENERHSCNVKKEEIAVNTVNFRHVEYGLTSLPTQRDDLKSKERDLLAFISHEAEGVFKYLERVVTLKG